MEAFQAGDESVGEKLPLEGTQGFQPLQTIDMHKNLYNPLQEREKPKKHNKASLKLEGFLCSEKKKGFGCSQEKGKTSVRLREHEQE